MNQQYVNIPSLLSLFPVPPSRSSVIAEHWVELLAAASHWLAVLRMVMYICQCYSLRSPHLSFLLCVHKSITMFIPGQGCLKAAGGELKVFSKSQWDNTSRPWQLDFHTSSLVAEEVSHCLLYVPWLKAHSRALRVMPCLLPIWKLIWWEDKESSSSLSFPSLWPFSNILIIVRHQCVLHHSVI